MVPMLELTQSESLPAFPMTTILLTARPANGVVVKAGNLFLGAPRLTDPLQLGDAGLL